MLSRFQSYLAGVTMLTTIMGVFLAAVMGIIVYQLNYNQTIVYHEWIHNKVFFYYFLWVILSLYILIVLYSSTHTFKTIYDSLQTVEEEESKEITVEIRYPMMLLFGSMIFTIIINIILESLLLPTLLGLFIILVWTWLTFSSLGRPSFNITARIRLK